MFKSWLATALGLVLISALSPARADTNWTAVDRCPNINGFQYQDGTAYEYWWAVGSSTNASGHPVQTYENGNGGTSTMEWDPATARLIDWTIHLGGSASLSYTGGTSAAYGYRVGWFTQTSGSTALNKIVGINDVPYQPNAELLGPVAISVPRTEFSDTIFLQSFTYNGTTYQLLDRSYDYQWRIIAHCTGGATIVTSAADLVSYPEQLEINFSDGKYARYIGERGITYTYRPSSTAPNQLTKINGYPLSASGNTVALARPAIQSFVWNGNLYTLATPFWTLDFASSLQLVYFYTSQTAVYSGSPGSTPYCVGYAAVCYAWINPAGSFVRLWVQDSPNNDWSSMEEEDALLMGGPVNFSLQDVIGSCSFTAINGHPYLTVGSAVTPVPPVSSFVYGGKTYQYQSSALASDGSVATQYTAPGNGTATVNWSQSTYDVATLKVKPTAGANTATYVNGETVGRPGAYVWSSASTSPNQLTKVNASLFTVNGDAALPTGGYANSSGIFDVQGNFMTLGQWSNSPNHIGFSLSYDDGEPVTVPASIEFTASRPLTTWLWTNTTLDGSSVTQVMQLDENSRLLLYPPGSDVPGAPAVPEPTVVLDPNPGGISRFDGPVRIKPQGDLSMGAFTSEPAAQ